MKYLLVILLVTSVVSVIDSALSDNDCKELRASVNATGTDGDPCLAKTIENIINAVKEVALIPETNRTIDKCIGDLHGEHGELEHELKHGHCDKVKGKFERILGDMRVHLYFLDVEFPSVCDIFLCIFKESEAFIAVINKVLKCNHLDHISKRIRS